MKKGEGKEEGRGWRRYLHCAQDPPLVLEKVTEKLLTKIEERFAAKEQRARPGPYALGAVAGNTKALTIPPPILSRAFQELSLGLVKLHRVACRA